MLNNQVRKEAIKLNLKGKRCDSTSALFPKSEQAGHKTETFVNKVTPEGALKHV